MEKGSGILNITLPSLIDSHKINKINNKILMKIVFNQYRGTFIDIEGDNSLRI